MAGITINTGSFTIGEKPSTGRSSNQPLKILLLANLSGCRSRHYEPGALTARKTLQLDKDNFDELFARCGVSVSIPALGQIVEFTEFEQLDPDYLYEKLEVFARYRKIIRDLKSKDRCQAAIAALTSEGLIDEIPTEQSQSVALENTKLGANLLDSLIGNTQRHTGTEFSVEALIRETIAPYVEQKADPRVAEYIAAVESAAADVLRSVMHASEFRDIESHWRSIDLLNRRLDSDQACQLQLMDVGLTELIGEASAFAHSPEDSILYQLIVAAHSVPGAQHYDLIVCGDPLDAQPETPALLNLLSVIAKACGAILFTGLDCAALGVDRADQLNEQRTNIAEISTIQRLQKSIAGSTVVCAPRYMVRMPYGRKTRPIESIQFEELPEFKSDDGYLWGNSVYLAVMALALRFEQSGSLQQAVQGVATVDNLPIHVTTDEEGDERVVPTTEAYLTERIVNDLYDAGIVTVQSVKHSNSIIISKWTYFA